MFHNIDPTLASAAIFVIVMLCLAIAGVYIAELVRESVEDDTNADIEAVARVTGMIDTNQYN